MLISHKIALSPNNKQVTYFSKACGVSRFSYNWALSEWQKQYDAYKQDNSLPKPSQFSLRKQLHKIKQEEFPWMLEVTKNAPQMAIIQLGESFKNFFSGRSKYPKFRKKNIHESFTLTNDQFSIQDFRIRIPKLGWVRMREQLRFTGKIMSATISCVAGRWFVSITVDTSTLSTPAKTENQGEVGVDLGVSAFATLSTGEIVSGPKAYTNKLKLLRRLSRNLSRKKRGSSNRNKARKRVSKLHAKIKNIRIDALHKLTTKLTGSYNKICIEDLNVKGMVKNRCLSRLISDMGFYEFRRQLEYKAKMSGSEIVIADRWYASSKICSNCNHKIDKLPLSQRKWNCQNCGREHQRDLNAAINLRNLAVSSTVSACGERSSGLVA